MESGCTAIAYETITDAAGGLPLLAPMSEVAGRLSVIEGAAHLKANAGGRGVLISGVPGTEPANVVIIGGGVVGVNAAKMAVGMGANVTILGYVTSTLALPIDIFGASVTTRYSSASVLEQAVMKADMVVGAVLVPGASAPRLVTKDMLSKMKPGSVLLMWQLTKVVVLRHQSQQRMMSQHTWLIMSFTIASQICGFSATHIIRSAK